MKKIFCLTIVVILFTSACGQQPASMPDIGSEVTEVANIAQIPPTATSTPKPTVQPSATPTPTSTPVPTPNLTPTPDLTATAEARDYANEIYLRVTPPEPPLIGQINDLPSPLGGGGMIVYSTDRGATQDLYIIEAGETQATRLTNLKGDEFFPIGSPDGKSITYFYFDAEDEEFPLQLRDINLDGTGDEMIISGPIAGWATYFPQGTSLVFTGFNHSKSDCPDHCFDLISYHLSRGDFKEFPSDSWDDNWNNSSPAWSPDGKTIAFISSKYDPSGTDSTESTQTLLQSQIYLCDQNGKNRRLLINREILEPKAELAPSWSPDGTLVAFSYGNDDETQIYVVNADGTNLRQVTNEPGTYNETPAWSPDGTLIIFWSNRSGNRDIYITPLDGSIVVNLTNSAANEEDPVWVKPNQP